MNFLNKLKPAVVDGIVIDGYYVCSDGHIWSAKRSGWRKLTPDISGNCPYPKVDFSMGSKKKKVLVHRVVCETFHSFPMPEGVSDSEWKITPKTVKKLLNSLYQVNHIDHNHTNHHPSNLEWKTVKGNARAYQEYRLASL